MVIRDEARRFEEILRKLASAAHAEGRKELEELDLTPPQLDVLARLYSYGETTQTALAQELYLAKSTVSGILDRLERRGLVRRDRKEKDRRTAIVTLTPRGEVVLRRIIERRAAFLHEFIDPLPTDEVWKLLEILEKIEKKVPEGAPTLL